MTKSVQFLAIATLALLCAPAEGVEADGANAPGIQPKLFAGASDWINDDINSLVVGASTETNHAGQLTDIDVAALAGIGPQTGMVLDDASPLPGTEKFIAHGRDDLTALDASLAKLKNLPVATNSFAASYRTMIDDDPCHAKYTEQKACNADQKLGGGCTWCSCAAVPSSCWTKANAAKLPAGVYTCDKDVAITESLPDLVELTTAPVAQVLADSAALISATSNILQEVIEQSHGTLCAFGACCKDAKDDCQVQMECVSSDVQKASEDSLATATPKHALDLLADAAKACNGDAKLVDAARDRASGIGPRIPTSSCAGAACKELHECIVEMSLSAVMGALIAAPDFKNVSHIVSELDNGLRQCTVFDAPDAAATTVMTVDSMRKLYSKPKELLHEEVENHPQLAASIGVCTLFVIGVVMFSIVYRIEKRKPRAQGHPSHPSNLQNQAIPVQVL